MKNITPNLHGLRLFFWKGGVLQLELRALHLLGKVLPLQSCSMPLLILLIFQIALACLDTVLLPTASSAAGITGVQHCAQPNFLSHYFI
jgi:hypothetical protein